MENDEEYIWEAAKERITYLDSEDLPTDCASIFSRNYFPNKPFSKMEAEFSIAQARIVFRVIFNFYNLNLFTGLSVFGNGIGSRLCTSKLVLLFFGC